MVGRNAISILEQLPLGGAASCRKDFGPKVLCEHDGGLANGTGSRMNEHFISSLQSAQVNQRIVHGGPYYRERSTLLERHVVRNHLTAVAVNNG